MGRRPNATLSTSYPRDETRNDLARGVIRLCRLVRRDGPAHRRLRLVADRARSDRAMVEEPPGRCATAACLAGAARDAVGPSRHDDLQRRLFCLRGRASSVSTRQTGRGRLAGDRRLQSKRGRYVPVRRHAIVLRQTPDPASQRAARRCVHGPYSPVAEDNGQPAGVISIVFETTRSSRSSGATPPSAPFARPTGVYTCGSPSPTTARACRTA